MEEKEQKIVYHRHACPNCGTFVGYKRLILKAWISAKWKCPSCDTELCFSKRRRILIACLMAGLLGIITYPTVMEFLVQHLFILITSYALYLVVSLFIVSYDKIEVKKWISDLEFRRAKQVINWQRDLHCKMVTACQPLRIVARQQWAYCHYSLFRLLILCSDIFSRQYKNSMNLL